MPIDSSALKDGPCRYLLQGSNGYYSVNETGEIICKGPAQAYAFVDVDVATARAQALIANGIEVTQVVAFPLRRLRSF